MLILHRELNIIIADDDGTTRSLLRMLLRENGYQVVAEAQDGEKAVELCKAHQPDIAFLDIDMPRLNGHGAAEKIRQDAPGVRMIMVSALPTLENVKSALEAGAGAFVVKPFNALKVVQAIEQCMKLALPASS
jgi:two-component system chemotaxis response regulator CheY